MFIAHTITPTQPSNSQKAHDVAFLLGSLFFLVLFVILSSSRRTARARPRAALLGSRRWIW
jgi:hypothetical protein